MVNRVSTFLVFMMLICDCKAQDIKGGEITTAVNGSPLQLNATVNLYVKGSLDLNRTYVILHWGDAEFDTLYSMTPQTLTLDTRLYTYNASHTYNTSGNYTLSVRDSFRLSDICNVSSDLEEFYVSSEVTLLPSMGINSSPLLSAYQVPCTYSMGYVYHNPGAMDLDGDSVSFSLVPAFTNQYSYPIASINPYTGDFSMPILNQDSVYLIVIRIDEWRRNVSGQYFHVGYVMRDMVIEVPLIINVPEFVPRNEFTVGPNPASEQVLFLFVQQGHRTISISDQLGHIIWRRETSDALVEFPAYEFPNGMYFYRVDGKNSQGASGKFVIQR